MKLKALVTLALGLMLIFGTVESSAVAAEAWSEPGPGGGRGAIEDRGAKLQDLDKLILWMNEEHTEAMFLPKARTEDVPAEELPLKGYQRKALEDAVSAFSDPDIRGRCIELGPLAPQGSGSEAKSVKDLILDAEVAFSGRIVRMVAGWRAWTLEVSTAAYIEVEEIIHGAGAVGAPRVGDVVAITYFGGRTVVTGTEICAEPRAGFPIPQEGDRIVVAGKPWDADSQYFYDFARFPVVGDEVRPEPRIDLKKGEGAQKLGMLVQQVRFEIQHGRRP